MPHLSVSLALARTASMPVGTEAPYATTHSSARMAAPGMPAEHDTLPQCLPSLPDLCDDNSDSSSSDDSDEGHRSPTARTCWGGDSGSSGMQQSLAMAASVATQACAEPQRGQQAGGGASIATVPQPAAWMGSKCHWERVDAAAAPARQQVELADCSVMTTSGRCWSSAAAAPAHEAEVGGTLPPLPPELLNLMPPGTGSWQSDVCTAGVEATPGAVPLDSAALLAEAERLRSDLAASQAAYCTVVRALHRKNQELDSLTGVVRDLTVDRARSASGRIMLQERCAKLLGDTARLDRLAQQARLGQATSRAAAEAAATAKAEAEGDAAVAASRVTALEEQNAELASQCEFLRRRVATLERLGVGFAAGGVSGGSPPPYMTLCRVAESF